MKKFYFKSSVLQLVKSVVCCILLVLLTIGCNENQASPTTSNVASQETMVVIVRDESWSCKDFQKIDTAFVAQVCYLIAPTGGLVAFNTIEATAKGFRRCYLEKIPTIRRDWTLSKQAEMTINARNIAIKNKERILKFLKNLQIEIFDSLNKPRGKIMDSEINGVLTKTSLLIDEEAHINMKKAVFIMSDGIQSINQKDSPAFFATKPKSSFELCLYGWKTSPPLNHCEPKIFESPQGFLMYFTNLKTENNELTNR